MGVVGHKVLRVGGWWIGNENENEVTMQQEGPKGHSVVVVARCSLLVVVVVVAWRRQQCAIFRSTRKT